MLAELSIQKYWDCLGKVAVVFLLFFRRERRAFCFVCVFTGKDCIGWGRGGNTP